MTIDPPSKIIIIGAGPIGLETALYARYLGYEVEVLEAGRVCRNVLRWGHVRMFSPFSMNSSPLGLAALKAQDPDYQPPSPDEILTGYEWAHRYLIPLSETDLLADHIQIEVDVSEISRLRYSKRDLPGDPARGEDDFAVRYIAFESTRFEDEYEDDDDEYDDGFLGEDSEAVSRLTTGKIVIDCSGAYGAANPCGVDEIDELSFLDDLQRLIYTIPDLETEAPLHAGGHTLVIGNGYSAATTVVEVAKLAKKSPGTEITWLTRQPAKPGQGPITRIENDRLPQRDELARRANELATSANSPVQWIPETNVTSIKSSFDESLLVTYEQRVPALDSDDETEWAEFDLEVDRIVANVGHAPNISLFRELQVHLCYATEGPMKLASALLANSDVSSDCLDQSTGGAANLITTEPNFYLLGSKSYGRNSSFLFQHGLDQIRDLFTIIGGREGLDLYASHREPG